MNSENERGEIQRDLNFLIFYKYSCRQIYRYQVQNYILIFYLMGGNTKSDCAKAVGVGATSGLALGVGVVKIAMNKAVIAEAAFAAETGTSVIAGSIFGSTIKASTVFGASTATQSLLLGMTSATLVGVGLIVACISVGCVIGYVYTRCKDPKKGGGNQPGPPQQGSGKQPTIEQAYSKIKLDEKAVMTQSKSIDLPQFKPIKMSKAQFDDIRMLTEEIYNQSLKGIICETGSYQVMRQPCRMKCCERLNKFGEKVYIQNELNKSKRCLLCQSPADESFIKFDQNKYNEILGLRMRLIKVYVQANVEQKRKWKQLIDGQFGRGYTQKYLENYQFVV